MTTACDWTCSASYFLSLTDGELLRAYVGPLIGLQMLMTVCHEAGHYYAAKLCGIDSEEFALGVGPAIFRTRATPSGCKFALRMLPLGGRVTYDDRYWQLSCAKRAFMSAAGWMADVLVALIVAAVVYLVGATGPIPVLVCCLVGFRAAYNLLPFTSDCRMTIRYLWLAITGRAESSQ
ncbi:hypothetical protein RN01_25010 [Cupriavidus sp. SHE]|uniref:site-2 protease family protein n=1 Tax=Cupriavidus TaxID=106589 RepID=UPI0005626214|nr:MULTISPECIES: site-2 protease family protein [Cupriavidus]KWR78041.1 hypothetical protein RN01_25010 [Cupriavidus sp. SHE]GMG95136.1 hypothetical protein Cmtc_63560 [Cupriavidus sp. TKC]